MTRSAYSSLTTVGSRRRRQQWINIQLRCRCTSTAAGFNYTFDVWRPVPHYRIVPSSQKSLPRPTIYRKKSAPPGGRPNGTNFYR